ncbi:MAG: hypothetical protein ACLFN8_04535 [Candidatus Woesearchaeota archaeon]
MIGQTPLNEKEKQTLTKIIDKFKIGESAQDQMLNKIIKKLNEQYRDHKELEFEIKYTQQKYTSLENYRIIINKTNNDALAFAYFDYPLKKSELYIATNIIKLKKPLIIAAEHAAYFTHYRLTNINDDEGFTIKIPSDILTTNTEEQKKPLHLKQTLEYFQKIKEPKDLFEVIDNEEIPKNYINKLFEKK